MLVAVATAIGAAAAVGVLQRDEDLAAADQPRRLLGHPVRHEHRPVRGTSTTSPAAGSRRIYAPAFADDLSLKTSNAIASFAGNRWLDVDFADYAPSGLAAERVTAEVDFSDDNKDAKTACMYMEAPPAVDRGRRSRRTAARWSRSAVSGRDPAHRSRRTLAVTSTDVANDLRLRIYFNDEGASAVLAATAP